MNKYRVMKRDGRWVIHYPGSSIWYWRHTWREAILMALSLSIEMEKLRRP